MLLKANDYFKAQQTATPEATAMQALATQKVLYTNTKFLQELIKYAPADYEEMTTGAATDERRKYERMVQDVCQHDVVLIPYFPERDSATSDLQHTPMLVELRPREYQATLYTKAGDRVTSSTNREDGETPTPVEATADIISEEVMKIFATCAKHWGETFDVENVDGGTSEIAVSCDEDYLVSMAQHIPNRRYTAVSYIGLKHELMY